VNPFPGFLYALRALLELAFATRELREQCEQETVAHRELGREVATMLKRRLADLLAAETIEDLVVGNPRQVIENEHSSIQITLSDGYCLVLGANHAKTMIDNIGQPDWSNVRRVKVLRIGICHD